MTGSGVVAPTSTVWFPPIALIADLLRETAEEMLGPMGWHSTSPGWVARGVDRLAYDFGVRILAGTDAGMDLHGIVAREIRLLHSFGLPPEAPLAAGSWEARSYLGLPGMETGAPADLVIFPDDPR